MATVSTSSTYSSASPNGFRADFGSGGWRESTLLRIAGSFFFVVFTCIFAIVGSVVGAVAGGLIGLAAESGLFRGAGIGAISGAVFSIESVDSTLALWHSSEDGPGTTSLIFVIDIIDSLLSGRLVREKVDPAVQSAVRSQMSARIQLVDSTHGAPQCPYPDAKLSGAINTGLFDCVWSNFTTTRFATTDLAGSPTRGPSGRVSMRRRYSSVSLLLQKYSHAFEESHGFGWNYEADPTHDWEVLMANKNAELQRLTGIYKNTLSNAGVQLIEGRGKIVGPHTVDVDGKIYTARNILISVGGRPFIPDIPGKEYVIDSDAALDLPSRPGKIAIVGGGYIAMEFAGIFNGLNSEVHVFIRQKKVLRGFDEEVRDFVAEQMSLRGIEFHTEESPQAIIKSADGLLSVKTSKGTSGGFSHVMFATGRRPNTKNMGLEEAGVKLADNGAIEVNDYSQTSVDSIWAIGDATDRVNLTPVALMEGGAFAKTVFGNQPTKADYRAIPAAVFCQPPIAQVGLTEEQAVLEYGDIDVFTSNFRPLKETISGLPDRSFMKIIVSTNTDKVVGVHMCGEDAPEIMQGIAIAVKAGLSKSDFDATVGIHPTAAEEFVTMRTPTRKHRKSRSESEGKVDSMKSPAQV